MKRSLSAVLFLLMTPVGALAAPDVFISEIAWAGSSASTADEWLELAGGGAAPVDVSGWTIEGASSEPLVLPEGSAVAAGETFLIANYGADESKSTLAAAPDLVTTAVALPNSALHLILRDAAGNVVDEAGASGTPPFAGGTGTAKASMTRRWPLLSGGDPAAWETSATSSGFDAGAAELGTPGSHVSPPEGAVSSPEEAMTEPPEAGPPASTSPSSTAAEPLAALRLSEIQPFTLDDGPEWVELVNPSATGEVLSGWTIEDGSGASTPLEGVILPWARLVVEAPKGRLNDDGDIVVLRDGRGRVVDLVEYGKLKRDESWMRVELRDAWTATTTPTKGAANVMTGREEPKSQEKAIESSEADIQESRPVPASSSPVILSGAKDPSFPSMKSGPRDSSPRLAAQDDGKKAESQKKQKNRVARFKGLAYEATVAVPPGVYGKTRMIVTVGGVLRELRLNRSATAAYEPGERIRFVAQGKRDGEAEFLLANVNSLSTLDVVEEPEFAPTDRWPESTGAFALEGTVSTVEARRLLLLLDGREGAVHLPAAMGKPALKQGDAVRVLGFVSATASPAAFIADPSALTLVKGYVDPKDLPDAGRRLPWAAAAALTAVAVAAGVLAYLRHQRLRRLAFAGQAPLDDGT